MNHLQKKEHRIQEELNKKNQDEMDGCTFAPSVKGFTKLPDKSYVGGDEHHHQLQTYMEGQSYGLTSDEDNRAVRLAAITKEINYMNNL